MSGARRSLAEPHPPSIPGYRIDGVLGKGATGIVYLARQLSMDREVALKVLHPELVRNMRSVKRLQREARTAARLSHPNLISAIDMGQTEGSWWFAMELVHGPSLAEELEKKGRLEEARALPIFIHLCEALQHACERGVVHRDVKPANILLEKGDVPRLVDLGLARVDEDPMITRTGATLGTPHYISPEQARDPALADVRSDIWSLGATMYHVVCGQPPFDGVTTAEILSGVLYGAIPDPLELRPELSRGLALVLRKCLSRDPARRYYNPAELGEDLRRVRDRKPPAIRRRALEPLDPTVDTGRRRGLLGAAGVGGLVVAAVLLLFWHPWNRDAPERSSGPPRAVREPWEPASRLLEDVKTGSLRVGTALDRLAALDARAPETAKAELENARTYLELRLDQELRHFWPTAETKVRGWIMDHRFAEARSYLESGLEHEMMEALCIETSLPLAWDGGQFESKRQRFARAVEEEEQRAFELAVTSITGWVESVLLPRVDRLQARGAWSEARELLDRDLAALGAEAPCDLRGLEPSLLYEALAPVRRRMRSRGEELEQAWRTLDYHTLRPEVDRLADRAEERVLGRSALRQVAELGGAFDAFLAEHGLTRAELERAPIHLSLDYLLARQRDLLFLEDRLLEEEARERLAELDRRVEPLFRRRAYEEAEAFWSRNADDEELPSAREIIAARVEEAVVLRDLLNRAAAGVREKIGREVRLPQGGLYVQGTVESEGEPLRDGFGVVLSSSSSKEFVLRPPAKRGCEVLDYRSVEYFVTGGVVDTEVAADLRLPLALFRFHEGDYEGSQELCKVGDSEAARLVERELSRRVDAKLDSEKVVESRRRKLAVAEFRAVMDEATDIDDPELLAGRIQRLILEYGGAGDVLTKAEVSELRGRRSDLLAVAPPSTLEEFRAVYGPTEAEFPSFDRARLRYAFQAAEVGAWSSGRWYFEGSGWCGPGEVDLDELVGHRAPTLPLVDPLLVDRGPLEVTLRLFQPADAPPELFLVSVVGIHVAVTGPAEGHGGRVLADNTDPLDVASRAATGEGDEFAGLTRGSEHTIRLLVLRTSGKVDVWVDGARVTSVIRNPPRDRSVTTELSFRALEPLCVREVVIEGKRR